MPQNDCTWVQQTIDDLVTELEGFKATWVLKDVAEHLAMCNVCRSQAEHELEGAGTEVLGALGLVKSRVRNVPARRPELGSSPTEGDEFFEKLSRGARKAYGDGGGGASGEQGEAD